MNKIFTDTIIQLLGNNQYIYIYIFFFFWENNIILILNQDELLFDVDVMDIKVLHV